MPATNKQAEDYLFELFETVGWRTVIIKDAEAEKESLLSTIAYGATTEKELFYYKGVLSVLDRILNMEEGLRAQQDLRDLEAAANE